ncbi:MAG TPA: SIS domain-containing protein [Gemmatimonadaceae bacterium]|nr:SIS domain-containing protein [Gemmatimonadaceae bacterium]
MKPDTVTQHFLANQQLVTKSADALAAPVADAGGAIIECLESGGKIICFGNGGSATQANHLAEELVGRFHENRRSLPAISLSSDGATITCVANDYGFGALFERQVEAFAQRGDVVVGLTTSGKSENVLRGLAAARLRGAKTIALTGSRGLASGQVDHLVCVPSEDSAHIQEIHLLILHAWCRAIDEAFAE